MILQILLLILKIIGIILLVVLCLALLLLFYPIKYVGNADVKDQTATYHCKSWWLFHIIHITVDGVNAEGLAKVRLFGIPIYRKDFQEVEEPDEEVSKEQEKETPEIVEVVSKETIEESPQIVVKETVQEPAEPDSSDEEEKTSFFKKVKKIPGKIKELFEKIRELFRTVKDSYSSNKEKASEAKKKLDYTRRLLKHPRTKQAYLYVKEMVIKLLKHLRPKKVEGELLFGMEQPDQTGQILGYVSMTSAMFRIPLTKMNITPDFEKKVLDGYISIKGKFLLGIVLVYLLKVYFNRDVKWVLEKSKKIRK
ncbi:MAG: DUF2953 domain-containing protein [Eubacterium sp.]|nr:DUF2953 domain-containing protein [Eubacterium sp.]